MSEAIIINIGDSYKTTRELRPCDVIVQSFVARSSHLYYFSFKPCLGGRVNHNHLVFELLDEEENVYYQETIDCSTFQEGEYYICNVDSPLQPGQLYFTRFYSVDSDPNNIISLYYGYRTIPYLEDLFFNETRKIGVLDCKYGFSTLNFIYNPDPYDNISIEEIVIDKIVKPRDQTEIEATRLFSEDTIDYTGDNIYLPGDNTEQGLVSVIIVLNNGNVESIIDSILGQTQGNYEFIIIDNKVDNDCFNTNFNHIKTFLDDGVSIKLISLPVAQNDASCYNIGAHYANGEYLLFTNSNIVLYRDYIENCFESMGNNAYVYSDFIYGYDRFTSFNVTEKNYNILPWTVCTVLLKKQEFIGFDVSLNNFYDWDFFIKLYLNGKTACYLNEVLYVISSNFGMLVTDTHEKGIVVNRYKNI